MHEVTLPSAGVKSVRRLMNRCFCDDRQKLLVEALTSRVGVPTFGPWMTWFEGEEDGKAVVANHQTQVEDRGPPGACCVVNPEGELGMASEHTWHRGGAYKIN